MNTGRPHTSSLTSVAISIPSVNGNGTHANRHTVFLLYLLFVATLAGCLSLQSKTMMHGDSLLLGEI